MDTSLFNGNIACDAGLSIRTDSYDVHRQLGIKDPYQGLFVSMVRRGNSVGLQCFKPNHNEVLHTIASDHHNVISLEPDINFVPGPVDDTIISASIGVPT
eukprot:10704290-Ditylum_brightwellii.AAC.1